MRRTAIAPARDDRFDLNVICPDLRGSPLRGPLPPSRSATRIRARQQPNGTPTHAEEYEYEDPARPWPHRPRPHQSYMYCYTERIIVVDDE